MYSFRWIMSSYGLIDLSCVDKLIKEIKALISNLQYRWTWIWRTTVRRIFADDGWYAWSRSDAYQVFVICIRRILHMTDQFSWSHWVCHIQVHLYMPSGFLSEFAHVFLFSCCGLERNLGDIFLWYCLTLSLASIPSSQSEPGL